LWKKLLAAVLISEIAIAAVDIVLVALFGSQLRSFATFVFGNNGAETAASLLFIEGGLVFGAGAVFFSGGVENVGGTHPIVLDKRLEQRQQMRGQQRFFGMTLMLVGGPLLIAAVIVGLIA